MSETTACRSIFKNGGDTVTVQEFTNMWITLINQMERSKAILAGKR